MTEEILRELLAFIKDASPFVWQTLYKQVYVEVFGKFIWALVWLCCTVALLRFKKYAFRQYEIYDDSMWDVWAWLSFIGSGITIFIFFIFLVSAIQWLLNPDFYIIRYLLETLN